MAGKARQCKVCAGPIMRRNVTGICQRNQNCKRIRNQEAHRRRKQCDPMYLVKLRESNKLRRRIRGTPPARIGADHPNWGGGKHCACVDCGAPLGWRGPFHIDSLKIFVKLRPEAMRRFERGLEASCRKIQEVRRSQDPTRWAANNIDIVAAMRSRYHAEASKG